MGSATQSATGEKRFRTQRGWNNLKAVLIAAPFILTGVAGVGLATGQIKLIIATAGLVLAAVVIALVRDWQRPALYRITGGALELSRGGDRLTIPATDILDVSLMERIACRDYVMRKTLRKRVGGLAAKRSAKQAFMRFCTMDVGLRSYSFGLGRLFIDRMESARQDLLLLRLKSGEELFLSPEHLQEMMDQIMRLKRKMEEAGGAQP